MIERFMPYLNYLNKNIYITDFDILSKFNTNILLMKDTYEFNNFKEDLRYLITESVSNDGLYQYVLSNMQNNNYIFALSLVLYNDSKVLGNISITKKIYSESLIKLINTDFNETEKTRAYLLLSYTSIDSCMKNNSNLSTKIMLKDGSKYQIDNNILINLLISNDIETRLITSKLEFDSNTIDLLMYKFLDSGILKKYIFANDIYLKEDYYKKLDLSKLVDSRADQPKMLLSKHSLEELFRYSNNTYSNFEMLFHIYKRMQKSEFSIQTLAYIAQTFGLNYEYFGGVLEVQYEEFNIEFAKERFRILTNNSTTRNKVYQLEEKIIENIDLNRTKETKLNNNIAYYKNFYLKDGVNDRDKLITFLRLISNVKEYRTNYINYVKFLYKKILGDEDYKLYAITNNVRNRENNKVIPITIVKSTDTYYVVDPKANVRVMNFNDINNYLSAKEYYSNLFDGECDILC